MLLGRSYKRRATGHRSYKREPVPSPYFPTPLRPHTSSFCLPTSLILPLSPIFSPFSKSFRVVVSIDLWLVHVSPQNYVRGQRASLVRSSCSEHLFSFAIFSGHPAELTNVSGWPVHIHLALRATVCGEQLCFFDCLNTRLRGIATTQGIIASTDSLLLIFFAKH